MQIFGRGAIIALAEFFFADFMVNLPTLVTPECALMVSVLCAFSFIAHSGSTGEQFLMNLLCMERKRGEGREKERKAL